MNIHNKKITACWKTVAEWDWRSPQKISYHELPDFVERLPRQMAGQLLSAARNTTSTDLITTCNDGTCVVPGMVQALSSTQPPTLKVIKEMTP